MIIYNLLQNINFHFCFSLVKLKLTKNCILLLITVICMKE